MEERDCVVAKRQMLASAVYVGVLPHSSFRAQKNEEIQVHRQAKEGENKHTIEQLVFLPNQLSGLEFKVEIQNSEEQCGEQHFPFLPPSLTQTLALKMIP